jgi:hypothetical protein
VAKVRLIRALLGTFSGTLGKETSLSEMMEAKSTLWPYEESLPEDEFKRGIQIIKMEFKKQDS